MGARLRFSFAIASLALLLWVSRSTSNPSLALLGVAPQDESYFKSSTIKCRDGSKTFRKEHLNDDFCDCPDGTDEPGTSACPQGRFYCRNAGHAPRTIFSSRVNDGICDCCDGSDEYDGNVNCTNTCWEAGKVAREKLKKKITTYQDGVVIRKQEIEKAKQAIAKDEATLSKLKSEEEILSGLVKKLKEHKERIEKAEEEERLKKEKEEMVLKEAERKANEQANPSDVSPHDDTEGVNDKSELPDQDSPTESRHADTEDKIDYSDESNIASNPAGEEHVGDDHGGNIVKSENSDDARSGEASSSHVADQHTEEDKYDSSLEANAGEDTRSAETSPKHTLEQEHSPLDTEGLSKAELGRLVASRWTGENTAQKTNEVGEEHADDQNIPDNAPDDDSEGYTSENDDDTHKYDDDDFGGTSDDEYDDHPEPTEPYIPEEVDNTDFSADFAESNSTSWLDKIQQTVQNVLQAFNFFNSPLNISDASHIRKEYDDSSSKLSKIQSRISALTEKLKHDFGKEKEFYSFYDKCFETKQNKYVYKVCPFKTATQVEGHSTTQLGQWEKFEESYRVMQFSNGEKCWNGPDRSLKVRLRCGLETELTDVDEPSRCEYDAILSTPVLCLEEKLKELQQKLKQMNTNQPPGHDELHDEL